MDKSFFYQGLDDNNGKWLATNALLSKYIANLISKGEIITEYRAMLSNLVKIRTKFHTMLVIFFEIVIGMEPLVHSIICKIIIGTM